VSLKCPLACGSWPICSAFSDPHGSSRLGRIRRDSAGFGQQMRLAAQWISTNCQEADRRTAAVPARSIARASSACSPAGHSDLVGHVRAHSQ
jgi:hypothetical protein